MKPIFTAEAGKYRAEVRHFEKEGLSVVGLTLVMNYEDWKKTFAENLRRHDAEKEAQK